MISDNYVLAVINATGTRWIAVKEFATHVEANEAEDMLVDATYVATGELIYSTVFLPGERF